MNAFDADVAELLERIVPPTAGRGDWSAVLRSARVAQAKARMRRALLAGAVVVAAAAALVVGIRPFSSANVVPEAFADRALAAVGSGPVLHVVVRVESPGAVVDLATGRRETPYAVLEDWYKPGSALRQRVVRSNGGYVPGSVSVTPSARGSYVSALPGFTTRYQAALRSHRAEIIGRGVVSGRRAIWIRFRPEVRKDLYGVGGDSSYEVAVDQRSSRPLYVRVRSHGRIVGHSGVRILSIDTRSALPRSVAAVPAPDDSYPAMYAEDITGRLTEQQAAATIGRPAVWLGREYAGLPLAWIGGISFAYGRASTYAEIKHRWRGVHVVYAGIVNRETGFPDRNAPYIRLVEQPEAEVDAIKGGSPQPGTLLSYSLRSGSGAVVVDGVRVDIEAPNEPTLLSVARALRPISAGNGDGS